jgi:hypothetical protein
MNANKAVKIIDARRAAGKCLYCDAKAIKWEMCGDHLTRHRNYQIKAAKNKGVPSYTGASFWHNYANS